jgi:glycosyltransferase involved in cell wall biosynthesis
MAATLDDRPVLSVVMPNYNHAKYLSVSLQAIVDQSYRPLEIIVVDDCSTDNSVDVINSYIKKYPFIKCYQNAENRGVIFSSNRGLHLASGEYFYFAGADDMVLDGFFEKCMRLLIDHPEVGLCSGLVELIDENGNDLGPYQSPLISNKVTFVSPEESLRKLEQYGLWMIGSAVVSKREAVLKAGGYIPELGPFVDGFTQKVIALRSGAFFIPEPLACLRQTGTGYCATATANIDDLMNSITHMFDLMKTTYGDLFSSLYIERYQRECLYLAGLGATRNVTNAQLLYEMSLRDVLSPLSVLDRLILFVLRVAMRWQNTLVTAYLFARRRRLTWEMLWRRTRLLLGSIGLKRNTNRSKSYALGSAISHESNR